MGANIEIEFLKHFENDWFLLSDMADFFIGGLIGTGCSRSVYELQSDKRCVVKIDRKQGRDNFAEWDVWQNLKGSEYSRYLAPCISISSCGRLLVQKKTEPIELNQVPAEIPNFFCDTKLQNWGFYNGRPVAHDYANHSFYRSEAIRLLPAEFWSDSYQILSK